MQAVVKEEIVFIDYTPELLQWCKDNLVVNNPEYEQKMKMGLWLCKTPRTLDLYKINGNKLIVPFGCLKELAGFIVENDYETDFADIRFDFNTEVELYDYQEKAVEVMVKAKAGILKSPAGSGKTQMGIALACKLGFKTLWLTHTQDLLEQSYKRAEQYIDKKYLGKITAGKVNIKDGITFATIQTLCKQDLSYLRKEFNTIIVDECHRVAGSPTKATQFSKVLNQLSARHKIGLSATVHRADGLIKCCYALLGDIAYSVPEEAVKDKIMQARVFKRNTETAPSEEYLDTDGTLIHAQVINYLCGDRKRNAMIVDDLKQSKEHYNLILSDRISHLESLMTNIDDAVLITGNSSKVEREKALNDVREGKKRYLFATYQLAKEGLDIPRLDRLFLATPHSDYAIIVQSVGRIARAFEGKGEPVVYDYVDSNIGYLAKKYKQRCSSYKKCRCLM